MFLFLFQLMNAQVGIGTTAPNASSELEIASPLNDKGVLIPRMTQAQRNLIASPATSLLIYQTDNTPGFYYYNGTIWVGITAGASTDWTLLGNSGTTSATNFFGTTDDNDIVFKRNNIRAGFIGNPNTSTGNRNTSFGANTLLTPSATGIRNVAIGTNVLPTNNNGNLNVAIGESSMFTNTNGTNNTAVGAGSLYSSQLGVANTAIGRNALTTLNGISGSQGSNNTAIGYEAIRNSTVGQDNTAIGRAALRNNSTGNSNVAIGYQSGLNNSGSNNITIGTNAEVPVLANSDQLSIGNVIYGTTMTSTAAGKIGVGEANPNAKLQITSSNQASPAITDGIIIPKVDNLTATPTAAQEGMLVYLNAISGTNQPGFYYWDNDIPSWVGLNSTVNGDHDWYKEGTTTAPTLITDDMFHTGNVAIGKNTADYPLDIETTNSNIGLNNNFTNFISSGLQRIGVKSNVNVSSTGDAIGMRSDVTGPNSGRKIGYYSDIFGSGTGQKIGTLNNVDNGGIGTAWAINNTVDGFGSGIAYGIENNLISSTSGNQYGISNTINNGSGGIHYGIKNSLLSPGLGDKYGMQNEIINSSAGTIYGINNIITNTTTLNIYGNKTSVTGNNNMYGSDIQLINNGTDNTRIITGSAVNISGTTTSAIKGTDTQISTSGNSAMYGNYTSITPTASGTGPKYGNYNLISTTAGGDHYGVYSNVLKAGATNFAGYFLGNVGIGTTNLNTYTLPASRATSAGQIMQSNATGIVTWQTPAAALNSSTWLTTGNTSVATDFIGTNNVVPLRFVTSGTERMRIIQNTGEVVVGTTVPFAGDKFSSYAIGNTQFAVNGYSTLGGVGVFGDNTGAGIGVYGNNSATGVGVEGDSVGAGIGVFGFNSGAGFAVAGNNTSTGVGVFGNNTSTGIGVEGDSVGTGIGVFGFNNGTGRGVQGTNTSTGPAIIGFNTGNGVGVQGQSVGNNSGVFGFNNSTGRGVFGNNTGGGNGVLGQSVSTGIGVLGTNSATGIGVQGQSVTTGVGVIGFNTGAGVGVQGQSSSTGTAIFGIKTTTTGNAIVGQTPAGSTGFAVFANGNMGASGTKPFYIDHPTDPENKYLRHFALESNEVLNVYRGNVILDSNGEAIVTLPNYFDEVNINFSYNLTSIGSKSEVFIKEEIKNNQFKIAGGNANQKISWQVYAERNDLYLQKYPENRKVEVDKNSNDKGKYLMPDLFNQSKEKGIFNEIESSKESSNSALVPIVIEEVNDKKQELNRSQSNLIYTSKKKATN